MRKARLLQAGRSLGVDRGQDQIRMTIAQPCLHLRLKTQGTQTELQFGELCPQSLHDPGEVVAQDHLGPTDSQFWTARLLQFQRQVIQPGEKWLHVGIELIARGRQPERTPLKQAHAQLLFQLSDLAAHRRLLDPVRHLAHGRADPAVLGHIVEQFEVMDVHAAILGRPFPTRAATPFSVRALPLVPSAGSAAAIQKQLRAA